MSHKGSLVSTVEEKDTLPRNARSRRVATTAVVRDTTRKIAPSQKFAATTKQETASMVLNVHKHLPIHVVWDESFHFSLV